jgi:hypothetical protein
MGEIIGLVAELDKDRLLKTDLLGDTIESALSETGGTKDIGLHRTPAWQSRWRSPRRERSPRSRIEAGACRAKA